MRWPNFLAGNTPLKRFLIRLSALGAMAAVGFFAIAQAQRFGKDSDAQEAAAPAAAASAAAPAQTPAANDPFAITRLAANSATTPAPSSSKVQQAQALFDQARDSYPPAGSSDAPTPAVRGQDAATATTPVAHVPGSPRYGDSPRSRYTDPFSGDRYGTSAGGSNAGDHSTNASSAAGGRGTALDVSDRYGSGAATGSGPALGEQRQELYGRDNTSGSAAGAVSAAASNEHFQQEQETAPADRLAEPAQTLPPASQSPSALSPPARLPVDASNPLRRMPSGGTNGDPYGRPLGRLASALPPNEEGTGRPGQQQLEGAQSPSVTIEKFAPSEVQIGKPATFEIVVRNNGKVQAKSVSVQDQIPRKTRLVSTSPEAQRSPTGELVWTLGNLEPGEERTVKMEVAPVEEGELGSIALVSFTAASSARTVATRPELQLEVTAPKNEVMIGGDVVLAIKVSNPGTGPATGVLLREIVPEHFTHEGGGELEYEVGELKPGESRQLELVLKAVKPGPVANVLTAQGDGSLQAKSVTELNVVAPALQVGMAGPKRRFLDREATYTVNIANPGTAAAREIELVTYLPKGLNFVRADNYGEYDAKTRAVRWSLEELPANESGNVTLTTMPVEPGEHKVLIEGTAEKGLSDKKEHPVLVEGVAAILFQVLDVDDPIEVNGETTYEIRVVNQGSKAATDVVLQADFEQGMMRPISAEGPVRHQINGATVHFEKLGRLAPKADTTYRVRAKGLQAGDMRLKVRVTTNEISTPVVKEESTRVYADE